MFDDDLEPRKTKKVPPKLDGYSIAELETYIVELKDEIGRAEAEISRKKAHMNAAATLFKNKD